MRQTKSGRNLELIKLYALEGQTLKQLSEGFKLSESRVSEIVWTFLVNHGYKPVLHPGRLSSDLVLRVVSREKLERLYNNRPKT